MKKTLTLLIFMSIVSSFYSQTTLFSEDFEGIATNILMNDVDNSGVSWMFYNDGNAHNGSKYMGVDFNADGSPNNDELYTPTSIFCPANQSITWTFWSKSLDPSYLESFVAKVSINNGATWVTIATVTNVPGTYTNYSYNLNAYAGQSINLKIVCNSVDRFRLCVDDLSLIASPPPATSPIVNTTNAFSISTTSVTTGGNVTSEGTASVNLRGVCWSTNQNPTIADGQSFDGSGIGAFSSNITGLTPNTTYYVRAYATSTVGTSYGNQITFSTLVPCTTNQEVFLTNLGFLDQTAANALGSQYFSTFSLPPAMSYNAANPYNLLDLGKPVRFKVKCKNSKTNQLAITSGNCVIRTNDPNIIITDSTAGLNNVIYNGEAWSSNEFEIMISNNITSSYTAYIDFIVKEGLNQYVSRCIPLPIRPFNTYFGLSTVNGEDFYLTKDDPAGNTDCIGNGNSIIETGERIETRPAINNVSEFNANNVSGFFKNLDGLSNISVLTGTTGLNGSIINSNCWYNYVGNNPQPITAVTSGTNAIHKSGEIDFVFDYTYPTTYSFNLYLITAGGFKLFGPNGTSVLMNSSSKITYNAGQPAVPIVTGLNDFNVNNKFTINPNPSSGLIKINHPNFINMKSQYSVNVKNLLGQNLYTSTINNNFYTIDLSAIGTKGVYFVEILDHDNKTITNKKIILE